MAEDVFEPFLFVLDHDKFQNDSRFYNLSYGNHTVYVKDALGCVSDSYEFTVLPENSAHTVVVGNTFCVVYQSSAALYVENGIAGTAYRILAGSGSGMSSGLLNGSGVINISSLAKGYYVLVLSNRSFSFVKK